jgi:hypothetical protein
MSASWCLSRDCPATTTLPHRGDSPLSEFPQPWLGGLSGKAEVLDLTVEEPDIEDVVRRIYAENR